MRHCHKTILKQQRTVPRKGAAWGCWTAFVGIILVFVVHAPKLIWSLLHLSYAAVFANNPTLTASPKEHLRRAKKLLRRRRHSELLYAALEIRFAIERLTKNETASSRISKRVRDDHRPVNKIKALHRADARAKLRHRFWMVVDGERFHAGEYHPFDLEKVKEITGRLGDLLHPKDGLPLGLKDSAYYRDTRRFLAETVDYLWPIAVRSKPYLMYIDMPHHESEPIIGDGDAA